MNGIKKAMNVYDFIEKWFLIIMTGVMVVVIAAQVFTRYIMGHSLYWSEELGKFIFVWISWLGVSAGMKANEHIQVRLVHEALNKNGLIKTREGLDIAKDVCWFVTSIIVAYYGIEIIQMQIATGTYGASTGIPMWIAYLCVPISAIIVCIRLILDICLNIKTLGKNSGKEEAANG